MEETSSIIHWGVPILSIAILLVAWWLLNGRLKRQRLDDQLAVEKMEAERLKALDLVKSDFFSNVTHEFRTPLTLILGHLEQVIPTIADDQAKKELIVVKRNAKLLEKLINQLLDIAKIEADKLDLDLRRGNIVPFVKEIQKSFQSLSLRKKVALKFEAEVDAINIDFDPDKIELVLFNLLSNAFKFTDSGEVTLKIGTAEKSGTTYCKLVVQDTGIGIEEEQISKVLIDSTNQKIRVGERTKEQE